MHLTIDELFNSAIMSRTPAIIVEGKYDIKIYEDIAKSVHKEVEVYPIEIINGYTEGCDQVIKAVQELYQLTSNTPIENHIVGVIDRDVREFRNQLPTEQAFLILDLYSIESHFVTKEILENAILAYTWIGRPALGRRFLQVHYDQIEVKMMDIYYFSLESLKLSLTPGYDADFQYSHSLNRRKIEPTLTNVMAKIPQLDQFASSVNLTKSFGSLAKITPGKWLLQCFSEEIFSLLSNFSDHCGTHDAEQCQYCKRSAIDKCTYKLRDGINNKTIYSLAFQNIGLSTLDYIRNRFATLR
ncbi:DUF4435 domain-containing protein [Undibacterium sp. Ji42W]